MKQNNGDGRFSSLDNTKSYMSQFVTESYKKNFAKKFKPIGRFSCPRSTIVKLTRRSF